MGLPPSARESIPVYYDFASTIAYIAHRTIERMRDDLDRLGIDLEWRPIDLSLITGWRPGVVVEGPRRANALRVARELAVEVKMPPVWLDSRRAHAVALALGHGPREATWRERVWSAVFQEGRDIGAVDELERLGTDLCIDSLALGGTNELGRLGAVTEAAQAEGITGVPTFVLGGFPLGGIQEPPTMLDLFRRYVEKKRRTSAR